MAKAFHVRKSNVYRDAHDVFRGNDRTEVSYTVHGFFNHAKRSLMKEGERLFKLDVSGTSMSTHMVDIRMKKKYMIEKKGLLPCFSGWNRLQVFEGVRDRSKEKYYILSSRARKEFKIFDGENDALLATIRRNSHAGTVYFLVKSTDISYDVTIIRDVDEGFILMLVFVIDEHYFEISG